MCIYICVCVRKRNHSRSLERLAVASIRAEEGKVSARHGHSVRSRRMPIIGNADDRASAHSLSLSHSRERLIIRTRFASRVSLSFRRLLAEARVKKNRRRMRRVQRSRDDAPLFVSFTVLPAYCSVVYTLLNFCEIARLREEERERQRRREVRP